VSVLLIIVLKYILKIEWIKKVKIKMIEK